MSKEKVPPTTKGSWEQQGYAYFRPPIDTNGLINPEILKKQLGQLRTEKLVVDFDGVNLFGSRAFYEIVNWRREKRQAYINQSVLEELAAQAVDIVLANMGEREQESLKNMGWVDFNPESDFTMTSLESFT